MANVSIQKMASTIMKGLTEYKNLVTDGMKEAVKNAGQTVKEEIKKNAPKDTGKYSRSWTAKTTRETSETMEVTVYSPKKYQLAHLLEKGHATRNGGRTKAQPHIAPAEKVGIEQLEADIKKALGG